MRRSVNNIASRVRGARNRFQKACSLLFVAAFLLAGIAAFCLFEHKDCESETALAEYEAWQAGNLSVKNATALSMGVYWSDSCQEQLTFVDGLYVSIVSISTVGYGDISPSKTSMRIFTMVYILFGVMYVFALLSDIFGSILERYRACVLAIIVRFDPMRMRSVKHIDLDGDASQQRFERRICRLRIKSCRLRNALDRAWRTKRKRSQALPRASRAVAST